MQRKVATHLCLELLHSDAARCCSSSGVQLGFALEREKTLGVVELVPSMDFPSPTTTQELLLRSVSFATQSLSANASVNSSCVPTGNDQARRGLYTKYLTTGRARASVPHVAWSDFSHEVLDRIVQVRSVCCQVTQHTNETAQIRFLYFVNWLVPVSYVWSLSQHGLSHLSFLHGPCHICDCSA